MIEKLPGQCPQQQWSAAMALKGQSFPSRFEQGLPGEAMLHSEKSDEFSVNFSRFFLSLTSLFVVIGTVLYFTS